MAAAVCNPKFAKRRGQPWNLPQAPGLTSVGESTALLVGSSNKSLNEDSKALKSSGELDDERRNQSQEEA